MFVSVIMTVYNGADYLKESVDSILQQTHQSFEFIVVNDGSTDETGEILKSYDDPRLSVYTFPSNRGAAYGLNHAVANARGEWIFVQDADDISEPGRMKATVQFIKDNPELAVVSTLIDCIAGNDPISEKRLEGYANNWNAIVTRDDVKTTMISKNPLCHGATAFRKRAFENAGGYDPSYQIAYDYDLWQRLSSEGPIAKVPEVLYRYRIVKQSLSQKNSLNTYNEAIQIATSHIRKSFFPEQVVPKAIVVGSQMAKPNFEQNLMARIPFTCAEYVSDEVIEAADLINRFEQMDADCVLHFNDRDNLLKDGLLQAGFKQNHDYFQLYSLL